MNQKSDKNQIALNWLNSEKGKDRKSLEIDKKKFIQEIKKYKKTDLIPIPKKLTLWEKIKIMILGQ